MITDVGITASRFGISPTQENILRSFLHRARLAGAARFHHRRYVGGDEVGAALAHNMGYRTVAHPELCDQWQSHAASDESREPLPYLVSDRNLAAAVDVLIGLPSIPENSVYSLTEWHVVRCVRLRQRPRLVVLPNGIVTDRVGVDDLHLVTAGEYAAGPVITDSEIAKREEAS